VSFRNDLNLDLFSKTVIGHYTDSVKIEKARNAMIKVIS